MATLRIDNNKTFATEVNITESGKYSKDVYLKFVRYYDPSEVRGCYEMSISPNELELLGRFLIRQADEFRSNQAHSK